RLFLQGGKRRGSHSLDIIRSKMRFGQGDAQQVRALVNVCPEHPDGPVELVVSGRKAYLRRHFVEPTVKRRGVVFTRPLIKHRGRESGGSILARQVEIGPAGKPEPQSNDRERM